MKHTKGPWIVEDAKSPTGRPAIELEIVAGIRHVAQVRLFEDEDAANARLMAAAPELLESLLMARNVIKAMIAMVEKEGIDADDSLWIPFQRYACEVVEKATTP